jgi:predicted ester cyclase
MSTPSTDVKETASDNATNAKRALERVCSGAGLDPSSRYYSPQFVDHVNNLKFHGLAGTEQSVNLYKSVLSDLEVTVVEQVVDGDRVASRFVVTGENRGRRVRFNGITISRFENGLIVEDWSVTDTLGMLRQLGLWRTIRVGLRQRRVLKRASGGRSGAQGVSSAHCGVSRS